MRLHQHLLNADEPVARFDKPMTVSCGEELLSPHPTDLSDYHTGALTNDSLKHNFPRLCRDCIERPRPKTYLYLILAGDEQAVEGWDGD